MFYGATKRIRRTIIFFRRNNLWILYDNLVLKMKIIPDDIIDLLAGCCEP